MCLVSKYSHEKSKFFMVTEYYLDCHEKKNTLKKPTSQIYAEGYVRAQGIL